MPAVPPGPRFSTQDIPFSYRESWFGISPVIAEHTCADDLHLVSHQTGMHAVLRFQAPAAATVVATPAMLSWEHDSGRIDLVYQDTSTIRVRSTGAALRIAAASTALTPFGGSYLYRDPVDGSHVFTSYETGRRYRVTVITEATTAGTAEGVERLGGGERHLDLPGGQPWEVAVEEYETARVPYRATAGFDQVARSARAAFDEFVGAVAPWRGPDTPAAELAAYVIWSATVPPGGFLGRPAVLMSKHWMDKVWSWDHCFNALALAEGDPELARHQFELPFDHQDPTGALPDSIAHSEILYNFVKPPIHGWAHGKLRKLMSTTPEALADTYARLARWTEFWLNHRRVPGHELPHYQHGNDSGWDNATTFDGHRTLETADLAGFLVLQSRELAAVATELGRTDEAARWTATADDIRGALLRELWQDGRFVAGNPATGQRDGSRSLLDLMAITLGDELPADILDTLVARLRAHLTPHGLATEPVDSPDYAADGYWRGPIWAPPTVLIEDGLRRGGHHDLADEISGRFRALCEKSGFAENFDAETGTGLRDRAYTWTAAGYLILAAAHERRQQPRPAAG